MFNVKKRKTFVILFACILAFSFCFGCGKTPEPVEKSEYSISYNLHGGEPLADAIDTYSISADDIPLPVPTHTEYDFIGWNDGTKIITYIVAGRTGDLNLVAEWQSQFKITFKNEVVKNGRRITLTMWADGSDEEQPVDKVVYISAGETAAGRIPQIKADVMSSSALMNDDYSFSGWYYKDKDDREVKLDENKPFTKTGLNVSSLEITVYAKAYKQWAGPY